MPDSDPASPIFVRTVNPASGYSFRCVKLGVAHRVRDDINKFISKKSVRNPFYISHTNMKKGYVYIMTNRYNTVFYTGVTSTLTQRIYEHKTGCGSDFTRKYNLNKFVWFDQYPTIRDAIEAEKRIKKWKREWKIALIRNINSEFEDLYEQIL